MIGEAISTHRSRHREKLAFAYGLSCVKCKDFIEREKTDRQTVKDVGTILIQHNQLI